MPLDKDGRSWEYSTPEDRIPGQIQPTPESHYCTVCVRTYPETPMDHTHQLVRKWREDFSKYYKQASR